MTLHKFSIDGSVACLGHKFLVELSGPILTSSERELLKKLKPIGFIPFAKNFLGHAEGVSYSYDRWLKGFSQLIGDFKEATEQTEIIVAIDHEGGRVVRPPSPITRFPYAAHWGDKVKEVGDAMAIELKSMGINISFSPCVDIHSNPSNPVIGERAFGTSAAQVIKSAKIVADTLLAHCILPCAKHFPGHGDTDKDTHSELAILDRTFEELRSRELLPFDSMIKAGLPLMMTSHILFPKIESSTPATLSRKILNDILRTELGFNGVIVSDALGMEAIRPRFETPKAVVEAVSAGCDLFIVAHRVDLNWAINVADNILKGLSESNLSEGDLALSHERIATMFRKLSHHKPIRLDDDLFATHQALSDSL